MFWEWKFYIFGGKQKTHLFFTIQIFFRRSANLSKLKYNPTWKFCTAVQKKQKTDQLLLMAQVLQQFCETQQFSIFWVAICLIFCNNGSSLLTLACQKNNWKPFKRATGTEQSRLGHSERRRDRTWDTAGKSVAPVALEEHLEVECWIWRGDSILVSWMGAWGTQDINPLEYSLYRLCSSQSKLGYLLTSLLFPPQQIGSKPF